VVNRSPEGKKFADLECVLSGGLINQVSRKSWSKDLGKKVSQMGGYGSGGRHDSKRLVEESISLDTSWMLQNNNLDLAMGQRGHHAITWKNYRGELRYILSVDLERVSLCEMRLYLRTTGQVIYLHSTVLHFGGVRWWFRCPGCERRCAKLYHDPSSVFLCRICQDLTYESCIEGKSTAAFLTGMGLSVAEAKKEIAEDTRSRNKWRRKRDRRPSYKGRPARHGARSEKSLKRKMLEAKAMSDIAKTLGRIGMH